MGKKLILKSSSAETRDLNIIAGLNTCTFPACVQSKHSLVSSLNYIDKINPYAGYNFGVIQIDDELRNEKLRSLIYKLAKAVDNNSEIEVKRLKAEYGNTKEFALAKTFLDRKCKEIWNIFDNKKTKLSLPVKAMKTLGISNQPSLDFLFEDSLKYFEKENSTTTVDIIKSILNNVNSEYTMDDILKYLKSNHEKCIFEYNQHTVKFLAQSLKYNKNKLSALGVSKSQINEIFKALSVSEKIKCILYYYL